MRFVKPSGSMLSFSFNGALCGAFSSFVFIIVHDIFISNIWFSLTSMLLSGALCGFCVAWSFHLLFPEPSLLQWWIYNLVYVVLFIMLGALSVVVYEPVTTVTELLIKNEPPAELVEQAAPLTIFFTVISAVLISVVFSRKIWHHLAILLTCIVLVILLGLNVSLIGLVYFPNDTFMLVLETYLLILTIDFVYGAGFMLLQWRSLTA